MIEPDELYGLLARKPFQPIRLYVNDKRTIDITDRQLAVVGVDYVDVGIQAEGELPGICDHVVMIPLIDVAKVEDLQAALTSANS